MIDTKGAVNNNMASAAPSNHNGPNGRRGGTTRVDARDYIAVARGSDLVVIKIIGAGNMITAPALAEFAEEQRKHGFKKFVFDLERCTRLDSTFMGVMVGMYHGGRKEAAAKPPPDVVVPDAPQGLEPVSPQEAIAELRRKFNQEPTSAADPASDSGAREATTPDCQLSAVNVSSEIRNLMAMLGVDKFGKMRGSCDLKQLETTILPEKNLPAADRRRLIYKAHETLVEIDKRNEAQFGSFLKTLSSELSKG
jgi:hypothetical protein